VFYQLLKIVEEEGIYKKAIVLDRTRESATYPNFQAYWEQEVKRPFAEWAELEQTYQYVTRFAPDLLQGSYSKAKGEQIHARTMQAGRNPDNGKVLPEGNTPTAQIAQLSQTGRAGQNGISRRTQQKLDRLARDFPLLLEKVQQGEVSVHRACIRAGLVKEVTSLEVIKRHWKKLSAAERRAFMVFLRQEGAL
jgi:hypothetical protein